MKTYEEMKKYLETVPVHAATLDFPEIREKAKNLLIVLERFNKCGNECVENFYMVSFLPFYKKAEEIIKNF